MTAVSVNVNSSLCIIVTKITDFGGYMITNKRLNFLVSLLFWASLSALLYLSIRYALPLLLPFISAFLFAALLHKPTEILVSRFSRIPPKIISVLFILLSLTVVGFILTTAGRFLVNRLTEFIADVPNLVNNLISSIGGDSGAGSIFSKLPAWLGEPLSDFYTRLTSDLSGTVIELANNFSSFFLDSFGALGTFALKLPTFLISFLFFLTALFYIGIDFSGATDLLRRFIPCSLADRLSNIRHAASSVILVMLRSYSLLMLITFSELLVGFLIIDILIADVSHIFSVALIISLVDVLPVLGVGAVLIPWGILDMLGGNIPRGIALLLLCVIITVTRNVLEPKIMGSSFGVHPVAMLLALYVGGKLFGVAGIFLLPLLLVLAKEIYEQDSKQEKHLKRNR